MSLQKACLLIWEIDHMTRFMSLTRFVHTLKLVLSFSFFPSLKVRRPHYQHACSVDGISFLIPSLRPEVKVKFPQASTIAEMSVEKQPRCNQEAEKTKTKKNNNWCNQTQSDPINGTSALTLGSVNSSRI